MLKIGNVRCASRFMLSPMAGISDLAFRLLNRSFGCELAFVEMINARSLGYKSAKTRKMLETDPADRPLGVQLLGCEERYILRALDILGSYDFEILDFNAACPMKKIVRRGEGASLLQEPGKLKSLLSLMVRHSRRPVTAKIRIGWDDRSINARDVALHAQDAGIKALFIHGRTRQQIYSGKVDYRSIRQVKSALRIPVIASGDIFSVELAQRMFEETGCDGIAVARGALGNPWLFRELEAFFREGRRIPRPTRQEVLEVMKRHLDLCVACHGEKGAVIIFRKFFSWYTKGMRKIRPLREKVSRIRTRKELLLLIDSLSGLPS